MKNKTYTWESDFKKRARLLPQNRRAETVRELKQLIKDMYEAEFGVAEIGRLLGKDHTTIIHHLFQMGFRPAQERRQRNKAGEEAFLRFRLAEEGRKLDRAEARGDVLKKIQEIKAKRSALYARRREEITREKERVRELYKQGLSLLDIAEKLKVRLSRVEYLISYDKNKAPPKRRPNICVQQFDRGGKLLATFPSVRSAALSVGCSEGGIRHALCDGRYKSSGGFVWKQRRA